MAFRIVDPAEEQRKADTYRAEVERAQRDGGPWPMPEPPTAEEQEFQRSIASSENVYENFTQPGGMFGGFADAPTPRGPDNASPPMDAVMPSRSSFEAGRNESLFKGK